MSDDPQPSRKLAVALEYEKGSRNAPRVTAKGHGLIAETIIAKAIEHGVIVDTNAALAEALAGVEIDDTIPIELDEAAKAFLEEVDEEGDIRIVTNRRETGDTTEYRFKEHEKRVDNHIPSSDPVLFYEIEGPLFFGAAQKAIEALMAVNTTVRAVVLDLEGVPAMDVSGLVAFESALARLHKLGAFVIIAGTQAQPRGVLEKAGIVDTPEKTLLIDSIDAALELARGRSLETIPPAEPV